VYATAGLCGDVVLELGQVLHVPSQRSHPGVEVRALEVGHGLEGLLPYGVLLLPNQEKRDGQCGSSVEAVLAPGVKSKVRHHLNTTVRLAADDGPQPWLRKVKGYRHTNLTPVLVMDPRQSATVDRSVPVVAKMDECIV
jgi:hypothetical protein